MELLKYIKVKPLSNILLMLAGMSPLLAVAQHAHISEEKKSILTYGYSDPNPVPVLIDATKYKIYPYHVYDGYSLEGKQQQWKVVKLENDYIEVFILPEIGGKVWGAIEKSTGKAFIYQNDVIKFRNVAWRGPWTSGGIEFNFGLIGHTPSAANPVDYTLKENKDGSVSCIVGNIDLPSRTQWRVEIRLPKDKAYFETNASWFNPTSVSQSYYNWMTASAKVSDDLQFFFPGNTYLGHNGSAHTWPIDDKGRDLSFYKNNTFESSKSYHITGQYTNFMAGYYQNEHFGFGHSALNDEMPGHKLWLWSLARDGAIWKDLLTDHSGQYIEFQAGRLFNQYSPSSFHTPITQVPFESGATDKWSEIWFPVKEIGGLKKVSAKGIMNVTVDGGYLHVGINALAFGKGLLEVKSGGKTVYSEEHEFKPMDVFMTKVAVNGKEPYQVSLNGMDLQYDSKANDTLKRPFTSKITKESVPSSSELYRQALESISFRDYKAAKASLKKCIQTDPSHIGALTSLADLYYRSAQNDSALYYVNQALRIDTYNPQTNYCAGNLYRSKGDYKNAMECFGWAARSLAFRTSAYAQMAEISLAQNDATLSVHYGQQSLDYNRDNINALQALAVTYRKEKNKDMADDILNKIDLTDPLSHFADYERYLSNSSTDTYLHFSSDIKNEFPVQTFIELALTYMDLGEKATAVELLQKAPTNPLVSIWIAYLEKNPSLLSKPVTFSTAFVFPYRRETSAVLEWATSVNPSWKLKYYLALNYLAINRERDGLNLLAACREEPDDAHFYLTRASLAAKEDKQKRADLEKAYRLSPEDWRSAAALIDYDEHAKLYNQALDLAAKSYKKYNNYTFSMLYARQLLNTGQYEASTNILDHATILPFEGAGLGRAVYEQGLLLHALQLIDTKKFAEAIKVIDKSRLWPENVGSGKPYDADERLQDYLSAYCYEKSARVSEGKAVKNKVASFSLENFSAHEFNNLLALKVLKQNGDVKNVSWLMHQIKEQPMTAVDQWVIAAFTNDLPTSTRLQKQFLDNKYFTMIQKINQLH
jgi:Tfp pilus assembly protein PilF